MEPKELKKKDYRDFLKKLRKADHDGKLMILFGLERDYLFNNPTLYKELIALNRNKKINAILSKNESIADRKYQGWIWCQELCKIEPGAKKFGDWLSYQGPHFSKMEKLFKDFEYLKKNNPSIFQRKVHDQIDILKDKINEKLKSYNPAEWINFKGAAIPEDKKREIDLSRESFLFSFLQNNLFIKDSFLLKKKLLFSVRYSFRHGARENDRYA